MMSEGQKVRLSAVLHHFFWFMRWIVRVIDRVQRLICQPSETMRILAVAKAEADRASQVCAGWPRVEQ